MLWLLKKLGFETLAAAEGGEYDGWEFEIPAP
jgi:hypothetical protein